MTHCATPTLDDLLSDPLVRATMRADRVNPAALRIELTRVADQIGSRPRPATLALSGARVRFGAEPAASFIGPRLARKRADCDEGVCRC